MIPSVTAEGEEDDPHPGPWTTGEESVGRDAGTAAVEAELEEWEGTAIDRAFSQLGPDGYLVMRPSEEFEVVNGLPPAGRGVKSIAFRPGEICLSDGRRSSRCATPTSTFADGSTPTASRLALVTVRDGGRWFRTGPRRYLVAADDRGGMVGWVDHSPPSWDFRPGQIRQVARLTGLQADVETYQSQAELSAVHPGWVG